MYGQSKHLLLLQDRDTRRRFKVGTERFGIGQGLVRGQNPLLSFGFTQQGFGVAPDRLVGVAEFKARVDGQIGPRMRWPRFAVFFG